VPADDFVRQQHEQEAGVPSTGQPPSVAAERSPTSIDDAALAPEFLADRVAGLLEAACCGIEQAAIPGGDHLQRIDEIADVVVFERLEKMASHRVDGAVSAHDAAELRL